ncbi:tRNA pseudouridine(55) synthase TruB [Defluviitalea saccharophila]|uniref:tRNA pseudouridine synthase B n=1 Tax=Defluviitalea saccharophila TaxID=879970 RepID=A0ABZ2Y6P5_9FIRM
MNGILNIYKEKGYTSHDVVAVIRKMLHQKRVGHTGTLDPEAEGVLPICIGKATKAVEFLTDQKKRYLAIAKLGTTTTTQDAVGDIIETKPVNFDKNKIEKIVNSFIGEYEQVPPMYSAIKVNGKKLYELARQGKTVERKARKVYIYDIKITSFMPPDQIELDILCSKGTYIRTLCADIGDLLGCGAHMGSLIRTEVGIFNLNNSIKLDQLKELIDQQKLDTIITNIDELFQDYPSVTIKENGEKALINGNRIYFSYINSNMKEIKDQDIIKVYNYRGSFIGLYKVVIEGAESYLKPLKLFL